MRILWVSFCLSLFLVEVVSGQTAAQESQPHWIFFEPAHLTVEDARTSRRAIERRRLRADADVPMPRGVDPGVLADLERHVVAIRYQSDLLGAVSALVDPKDVALIEALPYVRRVRPVATLHRRPKIDDPAPPHAPTERAWKSGADIDPGPSSTALAAINALEPLRAGINGAGVLLGFLDTEYGGFTHRAFSRHRAENRIVGFRNFTGRDQSDRHGLAVASVAAGREEGSILGPAHGADLIGATTEFAPTETRQEEDFFVQGLEWLEAQGVDVVNVSLGYTTFDSPDPDYDPADLDGATGVTTLAVQRVAEMGVIVVTSAGNAGCASPDECWYYVGTPADARSTIAVGAVGVDSVKARFSSYGPTADGRIKPDVAAPGVAIQAAATGGGYRTVSGTSFSSPLVSGVVCQMLQANPQLRPDDVLSILRETSHQAHQPDNSLGWGIIDAGLAVERALDARTDPIPEVLRIAHPYPNPFFELLHFDLEVPLAGFTGHLTLFDVAGRKVASILNGTLGPGSHVLEFDSSSLTPGIYLYLLQGGDMRQTGAVVLAR